MEASQFCSYLEKSLEKNMNPEFLKHIQGFKILGIYGMGGNGLVLKLCKDKGCIAVKVIKTPSKDKLERVLNEIRVQEKFAELNAAPKILSPSEIGTSKIILHSELNETKSFIEVDVTLLKMQPVDFVLYNAIEGDYFEYSEINTILLRIINLFYLKTFKVGYIHGDLHLHNIASLNNSLLFIDFGLSRLAQDKEEHFVDFISLIGSLFAYQENRYDDDEDDEDVQHSKEFAFKLATAFMYCCNYLYGTQFKNINLFKRIESLSEYVYLLSSSNNTIISNSYPLNKGGISKLNNSGKRIENYQYSGLRDVWKNLETNEDKFKTLTKAIETMGYEFITNFTSANNIC